MAENKNSIRTWQIISNDNGEFEIVFNPLWNEAGKYEIGTSHPFEQINRNSIPSDSFNIYLFRFYPNINSQVINYPIIGQMVDMNNVVNIQNMGNNILNNVKLINYTFISGMNFTISPSQINNITSLKSIPLSIKIFIFDYNLQNIIQNIKIIYTCDEGVTKYFYINIVPIAPYSQLKLVSTNELRKTIIHGRETLISFEIENIGKKESDFDTWIQIPKGIQWLSLVSDKLIGSIEPNSKQTITILLNPTISVSIGEYYGTIIVYDGEKSLLISFTFTIVSKQKSSIIFFIEDEYTYHAQGNPKVSNAQITLISIFDSTTYFNDDKNNINGNYEFNDIFMGVYELRIFSENHQSHSTKIIIDAGYNNPKIIFMHRNVVKIKWTVLPTVIEEKAKITIITEFETNVPMPVIIIDPLRVDIKEIPCPGITQIDFRITNNGLVAADLFSFTFPNFYGLNIIDVFNFYDDIPAQTTITIPIIFEWTQCPYWFNGGNLSSVIVTTTTNETRRLQQQPQTGLSLAMSRW